MRVALRTMSKTNFFAKLIKDAVGIDFKLLGMEVLSELAGCTYELGGGEAKELSTGV